MNINDLNTVATITLKTAASAFLAASLLVGASFYSNISEVTEPEIALPSCDLSDYNYWLKNSSDGAVVVSSFEAPIQLMRGKIMCMGTARTTDNKYVEWSGHAAFSTDGVLGNATVSK